MSDAPDLNHAREFLWRQGDLRYKLDGLQQRIDRTVRNTDAKKVCILSSRQIGKSFWSDTFALTFCIQNKKKIARIVAPTLKQCQDIVQDNLSPICSDAPGGLIVPMKTDYRWGLWNGSSLRLGALERAHVDGNRGGNASLVIYEECGFVKGDDFSYGVNSVLGPQLLRSNGREIYVTSPSENPDHPLHTDIVPECERLGTLFRFTVFDSPSIMPEQIVEAMRRSNCVVPDDMRHAIMQREVTSESFDYWVDKTKTVVTEAFLREYMARIIRPATLMIIPDFDERTHVVPFTPPARTKWTVTIDWGGVKDKTVAILHTYDYLSSVDLFWEEKVWEPNTPTSKIVDELREWDRQFFIEQRWADVPGQVQVDLNSTYDYAIGIPPKSDWESSVKQFAVKFTTNKIMVHPRCEFMIKSIKGGMFNKTRTDFERSHDLGHCDAIAAGMYAVRVQDRDNPFAREEASRDQFFVAPRQEKEIDLAAAIGSENSWSLQRSFGKFRG